MAGPPTAVLQRDRLVGPPTPRARAGVKTQNRPDRSCQVGTARACVKTGPAGPAIRAPRGHSSRRCRHARPRRSPDQSCARRRGVLNPIHAWPERRRPASEPRRDDVRPPGVHLAGTAGHRTELARPPRHSPGYTPRDSCRGAAGCRLRFRRTAEVCPWRSRRCPRSGDVRREESDPARSWPSRNIGNCPGVGSWAASARHAFKSAGARTSRGLLTRYGRLGLPGAADRCPATESKRKRASEGTDRRARTRVRSASRDAVPRGRPAGLAAVPRATAQLRTNR